MKILIEAKAIDATYPTITKEVVLTEAETINAMKAEIPLDSKSKPIPVKYYRHICYHDLPTPKPCEIVEITVIADKEIRQVTL